MWVKFVRRFSEGRELTRDEVDAQPRREALLTVQAGTAYLTKDPDIRNGHVVPPIYDPTISIKGDRIVIAGTEIYIFGGVAQRHPQKWTCEIIRRPG